MTLIAHLLTMTIEDAEAYIRCRCRQYESRAGWERMMKRMHRGADAAMVWLDKRLFNKRGNDGQA